MAWYDTGTVSVTNGSTTVTGSGTNFISGAQVGEAFYGPDDNLYEIQTIVSATAITLADAYLGPTQTGQAYKIVPTQSLVADLTSQVSSLISDFQSVKDEAGEGKFDDGTAALPGITFNLDQDTGLSRPAANQLATSTGGTRRTLLSNTAFQIDVPITGTAVQSSPTDTTASKLLKVGAFGLGSNSPELRALSNTVYPLSLYKNDDRTNNLRYGQQVAIISMPYVPTRGAEIAASISNDDLFFSNQKTTDTWTTSKVYHNRSILGTVSQVAGVPTGALIERGSNANGEYVRFADGTQICHFSLAPSASVDTTWTFPAAFVTAAHLTVIVAPRTNSDASFGAARPPSTTSCDFNLWTTAGARSTGAVSLAAIGRWF